MTFYWLCPECKQNHHYGGKATTKATARCGSKNFKIWQYRIIPPKPPIKPPKATNKLPQKYATSIVNRPSKIQIKIDDVNWVTVLKIMDRGISTIRNKTEVKKQKGAYYFDFVEWTREFKKIEAIAEVMKLLEVGKE